MKKVLVILFDKVEEVEAFAPVDILRRAGADVKTAAVGGKLEVCGRSGILAKADSLFSDAAKCDYDAVVLPGGPGTSEIISNQEIADFLSIQSGKGSLMCAICAAPSVFMRAGIIGSRKCASHPSVADVLGAARTDSSTLRDGNLITSQGAGTAVEFALEIVAAIFGEAKAAEVSKSICYRNGRG